MKKYLLLFFAAAFIFAGCSKDSMFKKGVVYAKEGKREAALKMYSKILKKDPDYFSALVNRAVIYEQLGEDKYAEQDYLHAYKLNPQNVNLLVNMGGYYLRKNYPLRTIGYLTAALDRDPDNVLALVVRAEAFRVLGYQTKAADDLRDAQLIAPESQLVAVNKAALDYDMYNYEDALAEYTQALYNDPKNPEYFYRRGLVFKGAGHYANALADFTMAVNLKKDHIPALYEKAVMLLKSGDYEAALAELKTIKSINNKYVKAYELTGDILAIENPVSATSNYMAARKLDPKNAKRYNAKIKMMKTDAGRKKVIKRAVGRF